MSRFTIHDLAATIDARAASTGEASYTRKLLRPTSRLAAVAKQRRSWRWFVALFFSKLMRTSFARKHISPHFAPMQQWLLRLRRRGVSVLVVHHAGKNGDQRGISKREDLLDTASR